MTAEGQKPDGYNREQLQRMRAELCGFVDRTPNILQINPETHRSSVDITQISDRGFNEHFLALYQGNIVALVDDVMFYRFAKATVVYRYATDDIVRRRIAYDEFIPYMEYLLNTPRTPEERVMMDAVGYQPLDEDMKERIAERDADFKFHHHNYPPTFSPEYKEYFMGVRPRYLRTFEHVPDPNSETPFVDRIMEDLRSGPFGGLSGIPQDVVREDLPVPDEIEFIPPSKNENDLAKTIREGANAALEKLESNERRLLILLFGFQDGNPRTTAEASKIMGITMDEVKKLEAQAFQKLRKKE